MRSPQVGSREWLTLYGHGTYVAGTIAARGRIRGVAPDAHIYSYAIAYYDYDAKQLIIDTKYVTQVAL